MPTRAYYQAHRAKLAAQELAAYYRRGYYRRGGRTLVCTRRNTGVRAPRRPTPQEPLVPIPDLETHPLIDQARAALHPYEAQELHGDMDAIARDLVGAYVLAAVAGDDPVVAMAAERARYRHDRAALVHGPTLVTDLWR